MRFLTFEPVHISNCDQYQQSLYVKLQELEFYYHQQKFVGYLFKRIEDI